MAELGDRRPIAARNLAVSAAAAAYLVRHRASPNGVSLAGMVAGLLAGLCFAATLFLPQAAVPLWLAGALLVQARLVANMLDGMVAIGRGVASPVGELYNDAPDRVSDTAILIGAGVAAGDAALGMAAALAAMATAYVRVLGRSVGAPSDFSRADGETAAHVRGHCPGRRRVFSSRHLGTAGRARGTLVDRRPRQRDRRATPVAHRAPFAGGGHAMTLPPALSHPVTHRHRRRRLHRAAPRHCRHRGPQPPGRVSPALRRELWVRLLSWLVLLPLMLGPVLAGRPYTIAAVTLLGLLCLREYDRATGLFREPLMTSVVALGIVCRELRRTRPLVRPVRRTLAALGRRHRRRVDPVRPAARLYPTHRARHLRVHAVRRRPRASRLHGQRSELPPDRAAADHRRGAERRARVHLRQGPRRAEAAARHQPGQDRLGRARRARRHHDPRRHRRAASSSPERRSIRCTG